MIYSQSRGTIVDYLGTHQHLAVDIDCRVDDEGAMCLRSGSQRFYEGWLGFRFPMALSGIANVSEWYDESAGCFRIDVNVTNRRWGPLFGYRGSFHVEWPAVFTAKIPERVLPVRTERRE